MSDLTLLHTSDIHFGVEDHVAIRAFEAAVVEHKPDGIVISGDLTQRGSHGEFKDATAWIRSLSVPVMAVPGNHDTPMLNLAKRFTGAFARYETHTADIPCHLDLNHMTCHGLYTARGWQVRGNWAEGAVNLNDLRAILEEAEQGVTPVLVCHHPLLSPPDAPLNIRTRRGQRASELIGKSRIDLILAGHVHVPTAEWRGSEENGYLAVTAGTLSTRLRHHPASYNIIRLTEGSITLEAILIQPDGETLSRPIGKWRRELGRIRNEQLTD